MGRITQILFGFLIIVLIGGCGVAHVKAKGKLLKNGEPFRPGENEFVRLVFVPADAEKEVKEGDEGSFIAAFNPEDSSFEVTGADGKGLLPGKYRVCVQLMKQKKDLFNGAFNAQNSPLNCEVVTGKEDLAFDLAQSGNASQPQSQPKGRRR
ncbi:MAG TPA: hypothetical protein VGZ25_16665 [Gemmataceae bacterium]|jgi:hypothetical protein|nr:hypothetical protein [Gemmataceae bacterium]